MPAPSSRTVVLVASPASFEGGYPLELASLVRPLRRQGYEVVGIDLGRGGASPVRALADIGAPAAIVLQISIRAVTAALRVAAQLRSGYAGPIIAVGNAAALAEGALLGSGLIDVEITGDPEDCVVALLRPDADWADPPPGCRLRWQGVLHDVPPRFRSRGVLEPPDRLTFPLELYARHPLRPHLCAAPIEASRGCTLSCAFCPTPRRYRGSYRARAPGAVVEEMLALRLDHGVDCFEFEDEQPLHDRGWFEALLARIRARLPRVRLAFKNGLHPALLDRDLLSQLAASGCWQLAVGVESGSAELRRRLRRPVAPQQLRSLVRAGRELGLLMAGYYMMQLPGERLRDRLLTLHALRDLGWPYVHVSLYCPWQPAQWVGEAVPRLPAWERAGAYALAYSSVPRLRALYGAGEVSVTRLPGLSARLWQWVSAGARGGGTW